MLSSTEVCKGLEILYAAAAQLDGWYKENSKTYIYVGEYGMALSGIATAYLNNDMRMPDDLYALFDELAMDMQLYDDPDYPGVDELQRTQSLF